MFSRAISVTFARCLLSLVYFFNSEGRQRFEERQSY